MAMMADRWQGLSERKRKREILWRQKDMAGDRPTSRAKARRGKVSRARAMASALGIPRHPELLQRQALRGFMD
jgi:hypothetical protein